MARANSRNTPLPPIRFNSLVNDNNDHTNNPHRFGASLRPSEVVGRHDFRGYNHNLAWYIVRYYRRTRYDITEAEANRFLMQPYGCLHVPVLRPHPSEGAEFRVH